MPAGLQAPEIPAALEHLWGWFCEISAARSGNGGGPNPIAFTEIEAWARLTGRRIRPRDVEAIMLLDGAFFAHLGEQDQKRRAAERAKGARA